MPQAATLSIFDGTFDYTFGSIRAVLPPIALDECRLPGINLYWLSHRGWCPFLFQGNSEQEYSVKSLGSFERANLLIDTQRSGTPVLIARAGKLTPARAIVIRSILISPAVFWLTEGEDNLLMAVQVRIDEGSYSITRDAEALATIEFRFSLSTLTAQRA